MKQSVNKNYTLGIKVLTPLHIGGGAEKDWVSELDFIQNGNRVYKINQRKLMSQFENSPNDLAEIFSGNAGVSLSQKLGKNIESVSERIFDFPFNASRELKAAIKTGVESKPFIPGSSIKGAIWSILFKHFGGNESNVKTLMGKTTDGSNFMRFIKISDAPFDETILVQSKIFNLFNTTQTGNNWKGGWKHGGNWTDINLASTGRWSEEVNSRFATTYEVIPSQQVSEISLNLGSEQLRNYKDNTGYNFSSKMTELVDGGEKKLFEIINNHTKSYIQKEIDFLSKYENQETPKIIESFEWLKSQISEDNNFCILKMAAGSGFHNITGDYQFNDYDLPLWTENDYRKYGISRRRKEKLKGKMFKSRKIAIQKQQGQLHFSPMGFVLLAPLEMINKVGITQIQLEKIQAEERRAAEAAKIREQENQRIAQEEKVKAEQEQVRLEMETKAQEAFQKANTIDLFEKFTADFPESQLLLKAQEKILQLRQEANLQAAQEAQEEIIQLSDYRFIAIKNVLNNYFKQYRNFKFSENQEIQIVEALKKSWTIENQNPKKSAFMKKGKILPLNKFPWTDVKKWVGEDKAIQLFDELNHKI